MAPAQAPPGADAGGGREGAGFHVPVGLRYIAASAFFFAVMSVLVKLAGRRLPSQEIVFSRSIFSALFCLVLLRRAGVSPWGVRRRLLLLRGVLGFTALSCFFFALVHLPLADATVIQYTNPAFTALIAVWALGERIGVAEGLAVLLSLAGVTLVARPAFLFGGDVALDPLAVGVALAGAILSGAAYVTVRRLGESEHPLVIVFWFALVAAVGSIPLAAPGALLPHGREWAFLLGIGVCTQAGQTYLTHGLRLERAGRAMTVGYLQILFAAALGAAVFDEIPGPWSWVGAAMVVVGTVLVARSRPRAPISA